MRFIVGRFTSFTPEIEFLPILFVIFRAMKILFRAGFYSSIDYKTTGFTGSLQLSDEGEVSWVQKDQIPNLDLAYDMLPLMEMMEAPDKSEFFYPRRTEDDWEKKIF